MSTVAAKWEPYFNVGEAIDDALIDEQDDIFALIGNTLDQCETMMLFAMHYPDYERKDAATTLLADHIGGQLGYDSDMVRDVLREVADMNARYRWSQHRTRLKKSRDQLGKWKSCVAEYAAEIEQQAEAKLEKALIEAGFIADL